MKNIILILIIIANVAAAQNFVVEKVTGAVKAQYGTDENWVDLPSGKILNETVTILTGKSSSVLITTENVSLQLNELSVLPLNAIKHISLEDLILALALDDLLNAPRKKNDTNGHNTAVYGSKFDTNQIENIDHGVFGLMRLKGAKQLSQSGFGKSAVVLSRETYRKYPETRNDSSFRIYFADILFKLSLYEEALGEYNAIRTLSLSDTQKKNIDQKLVEIKNKLLTQKE